ncbi:hypothetical protein HKD37_15G042015 [Glycine soja]
MGALFKLTQHSSVSDYLLEFETLANRIIGLPPPFLLSYFISGLALEIRREVQALQPLTLVQVVGLTGLQEEKFYDFRRSPRNKPTSLPLSTPHYALATNQHPLSPLLPSPPKPPSIPFKRLSPKELATRCEKDLCFNCDEKYHRSHKCTSKVFWLIVEKADEPQADHVLLDPPPDKSYLLL